MNYKQFNTTKEKELLETIDQILTIYPNNVIKEQVKVSKILSIFSSDDLFDYGTKAEFDFVVFNKAGNSEIPCLVIELNGDEHYHNPKTIARDNKKKQICRDNNIKLIEIPNNYSRRYYFIKDAIIEMLK